MTQLPDIWTTLELAGIKVNLSEGTPVVARHAPVAPAETRFQIAARKRKHFKRTLFTPDQREILLEWLYHHQQNPYPTASEKENLILKTGLHRDQLNVWFTNHRMREGIRLPHNNLAGAMESPAHQFHP
jgi:hypothetical protein